MDALEIVIKHMGIAACPQCMTMDQRRCVCPISHVSTGICFHCEAVYDHITEHGYDCPATALTRLSQTCKSMATVRDPAEVQVHIETRQARKRQFDISDDELDAFNDPGFPFFDVDDDALH